MPDKRNTQPSYRNPSPVQQLAEQLYQDLLDDLNPALQTLSSSHLSQVASKLISNRGPSAIVVCLLGKFCTEFQQELGARFNEANWEKEPIYRVREQLLSNMLLVLAFASQLPDDQCHRRLEIILEDLATDYALNASRIRGLAAAVLAVQATDDDLFLRALDLALEHLGSELPPKQVDTFLFRTIALSSNRKDMAYEHLLVAATKGQDDEALARYCLQNRRWLSSQRKPVLFGRYWVIFPEIGPYGLFQNPPKFEPQPYLSTGSN